MAEGRAPAEFIGDGKESKGWVGAESNHSLGRKCDAAVNGVLDRVRIRVEKTL